MTIKNEQGRSMVETLGVLAIIGVLSIGGMSAYSWGMNRHRANTIINSVSKMAIAASQQIELTGHIGLSEFNGKTDNGYTVTHTGPEDGLFTLTISGVQEAVCDNLLSSDWAIPYDIAANGESDACQSGDDNTVAFVFTKTLSKTGESGTNEPVVNEPVADEPVADEPTGPQGTECGADVTCSADSGTATCVNGHCVCDSGLWTATGNVSAGSLPGTCTVVPSGCSTSRECESAEACSAGAGNCYCKISASSNCNISGGTCKPKGTLGEAKPFNGKNFYVGPTVNWYNAKNWCEAHGLHLPTRADLGISSYPENPSNGVYACKFPGMTGLFVNMFESCRPLGSDTPMDELPAYSNFNQQMKDAFGIDTSFGTADGSPSNSCDAFFVLLDFGGVRGNSRRNDNSYALCVE